jgi:hypothetical protein
MTSPAPGECLTTPEGTGEPVARPPAQRKISSTAGTHQTATRYASRMTMAILARA